MNNVDIVIVGGGSAGLAAAIKCYELGEKNILILERDQVLGGILNQCIHIGFGIQEFKEQLSGPEYAERFINMVNDRNISYKLGATVVDITKDHVVSYVNEEDGFQEIQAKAIIITTGCYERSAGAIQLPGDRPKGVITAGTAQKYLNIDGYLVGKKVFILGSGDIGLIMARRMTLEGANVLGVAEIMPYSSGLSRNIVQCLDDFSIPLYLSTTVSRIIGKTNLELIQLMQVDENFNFIKGSEKEMEVDTLLLSVGLIPVTDLIKKIGVKFAVKTRSAEVSEHNESSVPGIFIAGNGLHVHDIVDYVSEESRLAAVGAVKYIRNELNYSENNIKTVASNGINYIVPHHIDLKNIDVSVTLKLRVNKPYKNINILIKDEEKVIKKIFKPAILPSEMEMITIKKELLGENVSTLSIEVEEK